MVQVQENHDDMDDLDNQEYQSKGYDFCISLFCQGLSGFYIIFGRDCLAMVGEIQYKKTSQGEELHHQVELNFDIYIICANIIKKCKI